MTSIGKLQYSASTRGGGPRVPGCSGGGPDDPETAPFRIEVVKVPPMLTARRHALVGVGGG